MAEAAPLRGLVACIAAAGALAGCAAPGAAGPGVGAGVAAAGPVRAEAAFAAFQIDDARAGGLPAAEVLRRLGPPTQRRPGGWAGGEIWSWRYATNDCLWFQVSISRDGRSTGGAFGPDPACDAPNDRG